MSPVIGRNSRSQYTSRLIQQPLQRSRSQPTRMKMQQKNNLGLGLGIACTQRINSGRWSNAYIACDSTGRLMEQFGNGLASRMPVMGRNATGVMADNPALIPLVGNNSRLILIPMQMPIFIQITWRLGFTFRSACLASYYLFIYLFIYLHYITLTDYILTVLNLFRSYLLSDLILFGSYFKIQELSFMLVAALTNSGVKINYRTFSSKLLMRIWC